MNHPRSATSPFKLQYANTEREQALATYTIQCKIWSYIRGSVHNYEQNVFPEYSPWHYCANTSQCWTPHKERSIFTKIHITIALTDEMHKCNLKSMTIRTESKHTIPAQSTRIIHASKTASNDHPITGTVQPLPQFHLCAKLIVAPTITIDRDKRVAIKIANTTDFSYKSNA